MLCANRLAQEVAVALQHPKTVALQPEVEEAVRTQIADRPDLQLARAAADRRVGQAVDRAGGCRRTRQVDVLEHHHPLPQADQCRIVAGDAALDDQHAGQAREDLRVDIFVQVRVVPVQALRVIVGDLDPVLEAPARADVDEDVVARLLGAHVHAVEMDVGRLLFLDLDVGRADLVDQPQEHRVAAPDLQRRGDVEVVVDVAGDPVGRDRDLARLGHEDGVQDTIAAADHRRVRQIAHGTLAALRGELRAGRAATGAGQSQDCQRRRRPSGAHHRRSSHQPAT